MGISQYNDVDDVIVKGDNGSTDGQKIASVGTALKVNDAQLAGTIKTIPCLNTSLTYQDMAVASGGVARGTSVATTFTTIYNVNTSGFFLGCVISMQGGLITPTWFYRVIIDSSDIFSSSGISSGDLTSASIYDFGNADDIVLGLKVTNGAFKFQPPFPIVFSTNITVQVRRSTGSGNFQGGFVLRS